MEEFLKRLRILEGEDQLDLFPTPKVGFFQRHLPAIVVALFIVVLFATAGHSRDLRQASGAFCDTKESATEFLVNWDGQNATELVVAINIVAGTERCLLTTVVLEEVERGETVTTDQGIWQLVTLNIWGYQLPDVPISVYLPSPRTMYTFIQVAPPVAETAL